jgi:hypothetical protein
VRKVVLLLAPPGWHDARRKYLRHDDPKWLDFVERQKMHTRQIIEVLKRRIKSGVMMLGRARLCARALSEMVQTAPPSALLSRFAH